LTELFASSGHSVFAGVRSSGNMDKLLKLQELYPGAINIVNMDVCEDDSVIKASEIVYEEWGSIDTIVNNAAILQAKNQKINELDVQEIKQTFETNFYGPYRVIKYFLPMLLNGSRQCIINISSEGGSISTCGTTYCSYSMSKAALNIMSQMFNNLLKTNKIPVIAVHPGRMNTDMGSESAQIEPIVAAEGIYNIITGKTEITSQVKFVDYLGHPMPL